jgi:hypothetical protein
MQRWTIKSSQYSNAYKYDNIFILASLHANVTLFLGSAKITNFQSFNHFLFECLLGCGYVSCVPSNNVFNMFQNQWSNGKKRQNLSYTTFFKLVEYKDCNSLTHKRQAWWPFVWNPILSTHLTNQIWTSNIFFGAQWKYFLLNLDIWSNINTNYLVFMFETQCSWIINNWIQYLPLVQGQNYVLWMISLLWNHNQQRIVFY